MSHKYFVHTHIYLGFIIVIFLTFAPTVFSSGLILALPVEDISVGDNFSVEVSLDSSDESINALSGILRFPDSFSVSDIRYSGSIVSLWLAPPRELPKGSVVFEGVIPGGYNGGAPDTQSNGNLFTIIFTASISGESTIFFDSGTTVYKNDGLGTAVIPSTDSLSIFINERDGPAQSVISPVDQLPPELFFPEFVSGEYFGSDGTFIVFNTIDKDSGLKDFEIAKSRFSFIPRSFLEWEKSQSPHALSDGDLEKYIFVRANDYDGNSIIVKVLPQRFSIFTAITTWWFVILFAITLFIYLRYRFRRRHMRYT